MCRMCELQDSDDLSHKEITSSSSRIQLGSSTVPFRGGPGLAKVYDISKVSALYLQIVAITVIFTVCSTQYMVQNSLYLNH
jgi:hypothetical protein